MELPTELLEIMGRRRPEISPKYTIGGVSTLIDQHWKHLPVPFLRGLWDRHLEDAKRDKYSNGLRPYGCEPIFSINGKAVLRHVLLHDKDTYELLVELIKKRKPDPTAYTFENATKLAEVADRYFTPDQVRKFWDDHHDKFPVNDLTIATVLTLESDLHVKKDLPYDPVTNPVHPIASWSSLLRVLVVEYEDMWEEYKYILEDTLSHS